MLDLVAAIIASGLRQSKGTPQAGVKAFHEVRTELVKKMGETERGGFADLSAEEGALAEQFSERFRASAIDRANPNRVAFDAVDDEPSITNYELAAAAKWFGEAGWIHVGKGANELKLFDDRFAVFVFQFIEGIFSLV